MVKFKIFTLFFLLFRMIYGILASSHWVVTEKGLIQPLMDSPFQMRVPNDLMGFLEQEKRLREIDGIYNTLKDYVFDKPILDGSASIPMKVHKTNYYCEKTTISIDDIDLYMSIAADGSDRDGIKLVDFFADNSLRNVEYGTDVPKCEKSSSLPFSMFAFEHLKAMVQRENVSLAPEHSLHEWLLPGTSVTSFGHQVALGLQHNSTSWLHYNLAAIYWRIKGEATKALECSRRAVHFAPRQYRDISLLNMGSIFHQTRNSADAAIVLHAAIDHDPTQPANYFALGNVYAVLEDFNQSVACYDNVLKLKPSFKQARVNKYAILCKAHHINELLELNDAIQNKYSEVRDFLKLKEDWQRLEEKLMNELAPLGYKPHENPQTDDMREKSNDPPETVKTSEETKDSGVWQVKPSARLFSNMLVSHQTFNPIEIVVSIQMLLKNLESELVKLSPRYKLSEDYALLKTTEPKEFSVNVKKITTEVVAPDNLEEEETLDQDSRMDMYFHETFYENPESNKRTLEVKYPPSTKVSRIKQDFDRESDWPSQDQCEEWTPQITKRVGKMGEPLEALPVYLPIENKGFDAKKILSDKIDMSFDMEHPLPWYPPICCDDLALSTKKVYLPSVFITKTKATPNLSPDYKLRQILVSYVTDSNPDVNKLVQEAEIGQRILTAIRRRAAPKWVLFSLASLYWRVRGNAQNTLDCLLCALEESTEYNKDLALTSLGSVLFELGYDEISIRVAAESYNVNKIEPTTNFLLSMLHKSKNNVLGQLYHMKQVIRVDPDFMQGWALSLLRGWHCIAKSLMKLKFSNVEEPAQLKTAEVCSDLSQDHKVTEEELTDNLMGMICTAEEGSGTESCQPANIQCYKTDLNGEEIEINKKTLREANKPETTEEAHLHCFSSSDDNTLNSHEESTTSCRLKRSSDTSPKKAALTEPKAEDKDKGKKPTESTGSKTSPEDPRPKGKPIGSFKLNLPPPADAEEEIRNLGLLRVEGESYDLRDRKMKIYDKKINVELTDETCDAMETIDIFKSASFVTAYSQRGFFLFAKTILKETYSAAGLVKKPYCDDPEPDFIQLALGSQKLPPFPPNTKHNFILALRMLTEDETTPIQVFGTKIAETLRHNRVSWVPNFLAAIFWRIEGNPDLVIACLRQAVHLAPDREKDVSLLGLSYVFQWLAMGADSRRMSLLAYKRRPDFIVNLFNLALMHGHKNEFEHAIHVLRLVIRRNPNFKIAECVFKQYLCSLLFGNSDFISEETLANHGISV